MLGQSLRERDDNIARERRRKAEPRSIPLKTPRSYGRERLSATRALTARPSLFPMTCPGALEQCEQVVRIGQDREFVGTDKKI